MTAYLPSILVYGAVHAGLLSLLIVGSLLYNPRLWLQDLPPELRARLPPKTARERRETWILGIPFMGIVLGMPLLAIADPAGLGPGRPGFLGRLGIAYGVNLVFNLVDLLLIDWGLVCLWTPRRLLPPGVEREEARDWAKHGRDFLKGFLALVVPSLLSALLSLAIAP